MATYFDVFNVKSDMQLNNIINNLVLTPNEMFALDDIINEYSSIKEKRNKILEMFSGTKNYNYCKKLFLKEDMEASSQLNMNQTIELNELFALASEKFKKVNCSQQFYQMLSQKTSKNFANAFFNMLKSIPEDSNCRFDPNLTVDGKNFAETIYPFVNELKTFLNGCKSESKKEEVKESIETQPDMFGGSDTYYKDGIEALDFDNVLDAINKVAPEMDFVDDRDVKGKYSMIFQPKSSGLELNQKGLKKIKDYLSQKFGKENISVRLAHSQYAPEIKKLYVTFINQIDVQDELENNQLNESELTNKLDNLKYHISVSSDEKTLKHIKDTLSNYFNQTKDTEDRNKLSEIISMINSKLNKINPEIDECCGIDSLLEPFKPTVINITVNDDGCLKDTEKEMCANSMKALASHINDSKDPCQENNIENMETINSLLGTIANYFHTKLCESQDLDNNIVYDPNKELEDIKERYLNKELDYYDAIKEVENITGNEKIAEEKVDSWDDTSKHGLYGIEDDEDEELDESQSYEKYDNVREELNYIKQRYLDGELDVYDATNEVDGLIGDKSDAEALVDSWDDSSKHGLYGINNEALLNKISNDPNVYIQGRDEIDDSQEPDVEKILDSIKYIADTYNKTFSEAKEIYSEISNTDVYSMEELDEDTVYDHSWYEVKGQKYPRRTKNGVEIKEGIKDWFKKDNDDRTFVIKLANSGYFCKDGKSINGDINDAMIITGYKNALKQANKLNKYEGTDAFKPIEIKHEYTSEYEYLDEMCSGGACCAGAVATVPSPVKPKSPKRKHKKSKVDEMALNMFKRQIIEDVNSQIIANGNHYEYKDGYFYINGDIARTKSKYQMLESLDEMIELETLPGFNSEEMKLFEDIEASGNVGNEDDNNQDNNSDSNNNANNNNNQQNTNQNITQNNLGNVDQNVTQDNDLTPQQRQLKKDNEKVLDQSLNSGNDTNVSVNQGMDDNNDTTNNPTPNTDNIKYKVIGKDDSDSNNIKYIIQDPSSKQTMVVDATKLRLEK